MSVVVGVDGTAVSRAAIRVAAQEARYRQASLIAVMTYSGERTLGTPAGQPVATLGTGGDQRSAAEASLRNLLTEALGTPGRSRRATGSGRDRGTADRGGRQGGRRAAHRPGDPGQHVPADRNGQPVCTAQGAMPRHGRAGRS